MASWFSQHILMVCSKLCTSSHNVDLQRAGWAFQFGMTEQTWTRGTQNATKTPTVKNDPGSTNNKRTLYVWRRGLCQEIQGCSTTESPWRTSKVPTPFVEIAKQCWSGTINFPQWLPCCRTALLVTEAAFGKFTTEGTDGSRCTLEHPELHTCCKNICSMVTLSEFSILFVHEACAKYQAID